MNRPKRAYALYRRPIKKGRHVYYAKIRDPETSAYRSFISTGCTRRDDAVIWCERHLAEQRQACKNLTFSAYVKGFWLPDGAYAMGRTARGFSMSLAYLTLAESYTRTHLVPAFGSFGLQAITSGRIDEWVIRLRKTGELAPATINRVLQHLRTILAQATAEGKILANPAARGRQVKLEGYERGVLSPGEIARLLDPDVWPDYRHFALNLLAYATGMRLGEVRGLLLEDLHGDRIEIRHNWQEPEGIKPPKLGSFREVPISPRMFAVMNRVVRETQPEAIIFYSDTRNMPIPKYTIEWNFNQALKRIGIDKKTRLLRHLSFHSWRHTANTILRSRGVVDSKVRRVTGHSSQQMSERYTHFEAQDYLEVVEALEAVLDPVSASALPGEAVRDSKPGSL